MAASDDTLARFAQLAGLEARLASVGLPITVADHIRLAQLVEGLRRANVAIRDGDDAARWLTPILARNAESAQKVRREVQDWWGELNRPSAIETTLTRVREITRSPLTEYRFALLVGALALLLVAAFMVFYVACASFTEVVSDEHTVANVSQGFGKRMCSAVLLTQAEVPPAQTGNVITGDTPRAAPDGSLNFDTDEFAQVLSFSVFPALLVLAPFIWAITRILRPPPPQVSTRGTEARVKAANIPLRPLRSALFQGDESQRLMRRLAAPDIIPTRNLDIGRSIKAAMRGDDGLDLVFRTRLRKRRYLLIVEAASGEDHIHLVADALLEQARLAGLDIPRFELRSHLSVLRYVDGGRHEATSDTLGAIARRHMGARLLILGTGDGLFAPDGSLQSDIEGARGRNDGHQMFGLFERPSLLSTTPRALMGRREKMLQDAGLEIAPLSPEGLEQLVDAMTRELGPEPAQPAMRLSTREPYLFEWIRRARLDLLSDIPPRESEIEALRLELRSYFRASGDWPIFMALMIMPTAITRTLTLSILHYLEEEAAHPRIANLDAEGNPITVHLPKGYSRLATLARLARLPWFQAGYAPDWLRSMVIRHSDPREVAAMRNVLQRLLEDEGHLPTSGQGGNPAVAQDEWVIKLFRESLRGSRVASQRELPLIKTLRGEDMTELDQPLPLTRTRRLTRLLGALGVGAAAGAALWAGMPTWLLQRIFDVGTFAENLAAYLESTFADTFIVPAVLTLMTLPFFLLDAYAQKEDARRNWLARLTSPSRAFLAHVAARRQAMLDQGWNTGAALKVRELRRVLKHDWRLRNGWSFAGVLAVARGYAHPDIPKTPDLLAHFGDLIDRLHAHWTARSDWADRYLSWVGRAIDVGMIFVAFNTFALFYRDVVAQERYDAFCVLVMMFSYIVFRVARLFGWAAPAIVPWSLQAQPHASALMVTLRLLPLHLASNLLVCWVMRESGFVEDQRFVFFWLVLSVASALVIQSFRPLVPNAPRTTILSDIWIASLVITAPYFLVMLQGNETVLNSFLLPAAMLLVIGQGYRLPALLLIGLSIAQFTTTIPLFAWLITFERGYWVDVPLATLFQALVFWALCAIRLPRRDAAPPERPLMKTAESMHRDSIAE